MFKMYSPSLMNQGKNSVNRSTLPLRLAHGTGHVIFWDCIDYKTFQNKWFLHNTSSLICCMLMLVNESVCLPLHAGGELFHSDGCPGMQ